MSEYTPYLARFLTKLSTEEEHVLESRTTDNAESSQTAQNRKHLSERPRPRPGTRVTHVDHETTDDS